MTRIHRKKALFLLLPLLALFVLEMGTLLAIPVDQTISAQSTLSALIESGPAIDSEAVMVKSDGVVTQVVALCQSLPLDTWKLLVVLYVLLLIFNFREQYRLHGSITTWVFECGLTFFFIIEWAIFDTCRTQNWFPLALIKIGLITFLLFQVKNLITKHKESH